MDIFVGLLIIGVVVVIALAVLHFTLLAIGSIIGGSCWGFTALINKLRGKR